MKRFAIGAILIALVACDEEKKLIHGYVEGEYLYIAPTTPGTLKELDVRRGDYVKQGQDLFAIDDIELKASIASAAAEVAQANSHLQNLLKGKRVEEIQVIIKQQEQAKAVLKDAQREFERAKNLIGSNAISSSDYDQFESEYKSAQANVEAIDAQLKVATLGAREDEVTAAQASIDSSEQKLIITQKQLKDSAPKAPAEAYIEDTFYNPGEYVPAGRAVVSILPPENIKIRFFIPQSKLPNIKQGSPVQISCDGCAKLISGKVTYISSQAEYAPPVIYSLDARQKQVFMVEATPDTFEQMLHPGLPVDIKVGE